MCVVMKMPFALGKSAVGEWRYSQSTNGGHTGSLVGKAACHVRCDEDALCPGKVSCRRVALANLLN